MENVKRKVIAFISLKYSFSKLFINKFLYEKMNLDEKDGYKKAVNKKFILVYFYLIKDTYRRYHMHAFNVYCGNLFLTLNSSL